MEKFVEQTLLYDFYGELLNEHQRGIYQDIVFNDLSLSEVADEYGISRQGVHDLIKRVNNTLNGYEEKLHLVSKFIETKEKVHEIEQLSDEFIKSNNGSLDNKELSAINDCLKEEELLVKKFKMLAEHAEDDKVKNCFKEISDKHQGRISFLLLI